MPVYYLLVGGLERAFGTGYEPGRVVSLASALGSALAIVATSTVWAGAGGQLRSPVDSS
jgi:hypothetical protein